MSLRSIELDQWLPVLSLEDHHFINLQYTSCEEELRAFEQQHGITIHHWQEAIEDYDETAALVCALDLVISVQTAIVHLSGALGQPAWVLIPSIPEWRYGLKSDSMPWYPAVRLFRQLTPNDWTPLMKNLREAVLDWTPAT